MSTLVRSTSAALVLVLGTGLAGCRTYNQRVAAPVAAFESGRFEAALVSFSDEDVTGSEFLAGAEAGMVAFVAGDWPRAIDEFHRALDAVADVEERALVDAEGLGEELVSWVVNEGVKTYKGEGYERVTVHACLALSYLAVGRFDDVLVEARRVDELLTTEEELYDADYAAGGLAHFLSALVYELRDQPDQAYVDYLRLADKDLAPGLAGKALVRLARRMGRDDDLARWVERYGDAESPSRDAGSVVLVAGAGMGPVKHEIRLDVPYDGGIFSWAVPEFRPRPSRVAGFELAFPGRGVSVASSELEDVARVAEENLADRIAWLAGRSAVRGLLKRQLAEQLGDRGEGGRLLGAAVAIFTIVSERADLRAWRTLPATWHAARAFVPPGEALELELRARGGETLRLGRYRLAPGETLFVLARALGGTVHAHVLGGERLDTP